MIIKPRGRPRKDSWWDPTRGWVRYSAKELYSCAGTERRMRDSAYASKILHQEQQEKQKRAEEEKKCKEQARLDELAAAAAAKAAEEQKRAEAEEKRRAKEWEENKAQRYAQSIKAQERLTCPVYYMANDGLMYTTDDAPRKRKAPEPPQREKKWRLLEKKVYGPTADGLCKGEWEIRDVWVLV